MRVSQEEKDRSHARIVESAARLVRERGIDSTSVADVMGDAGMTHGGFYRHFDTKEALLAAALESAFDQILSLLETQPGDDKPGASVPRYQAHYLSQAHVDAPGIGCPLASLGADVGRGSEALKQVFGAGVARTIATLAKHKSGSKAERRAIAAQELALMVGAVTIARAADAATARVVLEACRGALGVAGALPKS
jgi:TetR/AcrR family transcriptional repressor of nem operon